MFSDYRRSRTPNYKRFSLRTSSPSILQWRRVLFALLKIWIPLSSSLRMDLKSKIPRLPFSFFVFFCSWVYGAWFPLYCGLKMCKFHIHRRTMWVTRNCGRVRYNPIQNLQHKAFYYSAESLAPPILPLVLLPSSTNLARRRARFSVTWGRFQSWFG